MPYYFSLFHFTTILALSLSCTIVTSLVAINYKLVQITWTMHHGGFSIVENKVIILKVLAGNVGYGGFIGIEGEGIKWDI